MKNIWIINHYAMPPQYESRVRNNMMAKYLIKKGYNVKIFSASTIHNTDINLIEHNSRLFIEKSYDGLDFVHIRVSKYNGNGISRMLNMLQFPFRLYRVTKRINEKPDVIISNLVSVFAITPYLIARRYKAKFIEEVRDLWPESIVVYKGLSCKNPIIRIMYQFEKWIYKKADKIIFTMEGGKDYIIDRGWDKDMDMSKIYHINNGVDIDMFKFNKENYIVKDNDLDNDETFKVIYTGSIRQANNVKKIVEVAEIIQRRGFNKIKFLIYGDGSDRSVLENYCLEKGIKNITFKGQVGKDRIPYILSKTDLNIMHFGQSSLKRYGSSMNKMFEYLASGKPSISDCEFGYDIFHRYECGVSIDNADSIQLAEGILKFYNMPKEEYQIYCENALKAAEEFDFKVLTDKLEKVILED